MGKRVVFMRKRNSNPDDEKDFEYAFKRGLERRSFLISPPWMQKEGGCTFWRGRKRREGHD